MPFESKAQQRYLFANEPEVAKKFAKHTKNFKKLPEKVGKSIKNKTMHSHFMGALNGRK